jgi:hypothetical protein
MGGNAREVQRRWVETPEKVQRKWRRQGEEVETGGNGSQRRGQQDIGRRIGWARQQHKKARLLGFRDRRHKEGKDTTRRGQVEGEPGRKESLKPQRTIVSEIGRTAGRNGWRSRQGGTGVIFCTGMQP